LGGLRDLRDCFVTFGFEVFVRGFEAFWEHLHQPTIWLLGCS
jgi:hypothetical protein